MKRRNVRQRVEDMTFDLNLAPMLDMMVALVPFLLLSFVFIKLVVIESPVPQPVAKAIEEDKKNTDKNIQLRVFIDDARGLRIEESVDGKVQTYNVSSNNKKIHLVEAHKQFIMLKQKHNMHFSLELFPSDKVSYEELIQLMDEARLSKIDGPSFEVLNADTQEKVSTKFMFPNVTFGNILEG